MGRHPILAMLDDPNRAWLVLVAGLILVYRECVAPGRVLPGVLGGVAIVLAIDALLRNPWSGSALAAILAGTALILVHAYFRHSWIALLAAAFLITAGVHSLTTPRIGLLPALAAIPLSGITGFLLRTAILARRNKVSIE